MKCPYCDSNRDYSNLGNHWRQSCGYPTPSKETQKMFDGLLMGDGCLKKSCNNDIRQGNQSIEVVSINKEFIDRLYSEYSPYFTTPTLRTSAEDAALNAINGDVVSSPEGSVFRDQHRIVSRSIPFFNKYDEWKSSGKKRWPDKIEFTPIRLKYLYASDGGLSWNKETRSARSQISSHNEPEQLERLSNSLSSIGIDASVYGDRIMLKPSETDRFLSYLGDPVPGFEYKWENSNLDEYERLYRKIYYREGSTYTV